MKTFMQEGIVCVLTYNVDTYLIMIGLFIYYLSELEI